ncbi:two-component sensor histidine kinase [Halorhodospira halochloris]|uniref:histidine kinase n=2 Tax=Halorhodospira halochloris TaxID=1052 RepID=A0A0X8XAN5_HALHR|nr:ATP-binding protein [Halorhodospira halochloris]BAU57948.1 two-component sensor histidine kinase [Halorhodospira halochloris]
MGRDKVEQRTSDFSQNLLDKLPVAVCSLDSAGCFTYLNTAACQLLGYPDESALLGVNFSAVIDAERTPLPADTVTERLVAATDEPLCADTTLWLQPRVGAALPVEVEVAALRSAETAAGEVAVTLRECRTVQDITEQRARERFQQQLVAILDNTSDIVALHGEDGTLLYLNAAGRANAGIDVQAVDGMLGIADDGSMPPLSLEEAISRFHPPWAADLLLNEGLPTVRREGLWQGETAILKADGTQAPTSQVLIGHRNSYGELTYISTILRDISDQKKAQQEVAESERRFRLIAENIRDAFWLRTDAQTLYVNPAYANIWGQPVESFYANPKAFLESGHPEDRYGVEKALDQAISEREEFNALFRIIRSNSEVRWIQMHSLPVPGRESEGMRAGIARDVTEREQVLTQLREANRTKSVFLNAVSHDLRTPLNAIIGFTDLLADSELDAHQREQVKLCQAAGRTLLGLIDTLLDLSRLQAGRMTLQKEAFLLRKFLAERMPMLSQQAEDKGLNLQCSVDNGLPDRLQGDTTRLSQVLFNLVSNAIKFTDSGYVRVHFSRYDTNRLQVSVQDNGPGIPDELQERIFEPFDRGTDAIKHLQGSGLGLAISRQLVNLMGGEIWLHSTPGQGSTFYFTAELLEDESEPAADPALSAPDSARQTPTNKEHIAGMQVLVAEDEPTNILLIQALLERCGAEATVAENGQEALDIWQQAEQEFDLILLDMQMPILDGAQTVKSLREAEVEQSRVYTPVAMLSAHASAEVREQCLQSGADTYITKPVRLDSLTDLLSWAKKDGNDAGRCKHNLDEEYK